MQAHDRDDLALLTEAARAAGDVALRYWQNNPRAWEKSEGAGPVTEADLEIDRLLSRDLKAARPSYGWLSEESQDGPARLSARRGFIIDPIDGTRAFMDGSGDFSHALAVVEDGRVRAAVVYLPAVDRLYAATLGGGAFCNDRPLSASRHAEEEGARILTTKVNFEPRYWPHGAPSVSRHFRSSLAYRLALVGEGRYDGMLTFRPTWEWDSAAGSLIAAEAGAKVCDRDGLPLTFNRPDPRSAGVFAGSQALVDKFMARLSGQTGLTA
ncbi:3'(2'),5'-bisphosphate nucleotidase CysQ [Rhodobacteraceae bacterium XHP0102]|nr:3'(2'),5'-bisphosphate nucleotidase CysQ [Rhodobacteraceae bacterium XHP0102]